MKRFSILDIKRHLNDKEANTMRAFLKSNEQSIGEIPTRGTGGNMAKVYDTKEVLDRFNVRVRDTTTSNRDWKVHNKYYDIVKAIYEEVDTESNTK